MRGTRPIVALLSGFSMILPLAAFASDTIVVHARIFTANPEAPWASALSISGSSIDAIGSDREILKRRTAHTKVIDLKGKTVIPGIVDSHVHMLYGAYAMHGLNLSTPEQSITIDKPDIFLARLREYAALHPHDAVLLARADFNTAPPTTPSHEFLDRAVSDRSVVVHNTSEHALWLNSAALKMTGLTNQPLPDPEEERGIIRDASGNPTGVLVEAGMQVAARAVFKLIPQEEQLAMLKNASRYLNSLGITSIVNATGNLAEIHLFGALRDRGQLTVRTRTAFGAVAVPHHLTPAFLVDLEEARRIYHDEWVSANLVKFFADGSTGLVPPLVYVAHDYETLVMDLDSRGFQIMTHAIRNDSVHMVLDTYERLEAAHGARDRRLRIEHADLIDTPDIARFAKLGVIPDMQPTFCCGEAGGNFDPANPLLTDRWHSLESAGATLAFSSDWPCTDPPDPFVAIQEAVTRQAWQSPDTKDILGGPLDGAGQGGARPTGKIYLPDERISVEAAVLAYTSGSAYAAQADDRVGSLKIGKLADLAVLSQDVFTVPADVIAQTKVT